MFELTFTAGIIIGAVISGAACVLSSKYLGWFNKQITAVRTNIKP